MDLCVLLNLVQLRSRRLLIPVVRNVSTYEEHYMNFYEHFMNIFWGKFLNLMIFLKKVKICQRYTQDMVGIWKSGVWQYGLLQFLEPCSNKKPEASYTDSPNCQHLWRTLYELLWTFYEHFLMENAKIWGFSSKCWRTCVFSAFLLPSFLLLLQVWTLGPVNNISLQSISISI